ncbi:MAG: MFS transporter [Acidimicrobiia bacterium]|nr:MFS transporter [Acidimicrobiia bacterium]
MAAPMGVLLPPETSPDAAVLLATRSVRGFVDGLVSVILPGYLVLLGFGPSRVGLIITSTLVGSAVATLAVGLWGGRVRRTSLLRLASVLMVLTGVGFAAFDRFWPLMVVAALGTLNPSAGDVSIFLPAEQALLPSTVSDRHRTALFGRYSLVGTTVAALGSLAAGVPEAVAQRLGSGLAGPLRAAFLVYAAAGLVVAGGYRRLSSDLESAGGAARVALGPSRRVVYRLAALFSLDALGGGLVVQSLLALWLFERFGLSVAVTGAILFWSGLLSGLSALAAVSLARRIGLVRTMVFTHLPANLLLMATPFMPNLVLAVACLLARSALSQMDVPTRTSYVMAIVTPAERSAAAAVTNVPRSLAAALPPVLAGAMLAHSSFGWPLVLGGALKALYDLILLRQFRDLRPPEERSAGEARR